MKIIYTAFQPDAVLPDDEQVWFAADGWYDPMATGCVLLRVNNDVEFFRGRDCTSVRVRNLDEALVML